MLDIIYFDTIRYIWVQFIQFNHALLISARLPIEFVWHLTIVPAFLYLVSPSFGGNHQVETYDFVLFVFSCYVSFPVYGIAIIKTMSMHLILEEKGSHWGCSENSGLEGEITQVFLSLFHFLAPLYNTSTTFGHSQHLSDWAFVLFHLTEHH